MYENFPYLIQTQLGEIVGETSHVIGRWLDQVGLRLNRQPTQRAKDEGYCQIRFVPEGGYAATTWHREKCLAAFRDAGLIQPSAEDLGLLPPFTKRLAGTNTYELVDAEGEVGVWVHGEERADTVLKLLNTVR